ncbi:MAG: EAL domain-containing protein [Proteobacteria bacterium]|nr:EAL domain-containing protein [Pseudomonadota bacterium]
MDAVNVSPVQFKRGTIVDTVVKVFRRTSIDPAALELEITESLIMEDVDAAMGLLDELHRLRVSLAIDDFGTGYSSLAFLKRFPVNKLKIDRSFIRDIAHDPDDAAITRAIITLGESLNLDVIAEGVESEEQLAFLRNQRCREVQGFLISKPLPADAFVEWHASHNRRAFASAS